MKTCAVISKSSAVISKTSAVISKSSYRVSREIRDGTGPLIGPRPQGQVKIKMGKGK
jgi:hypothetical protein